jgi:hypothetical protein
MTTDNKDELIEQLRWMVAEAQTELDGIRFRATPKHLATAIAEAIECSPEQATKAARAVIEHLGIEVEEWG